MTRFSLEKENRRITTGARVIYSKGNEQHSLQCTCMYKQNLFIKIPFYDVLK